METEKLEVKPPPSPGSTDTEEYDTWTVVGKANNLEGDSLKADSASPKITINRESDADDDQEKLEDTCQEFTNKENLLRTPSRNRSNADSRVEDIEDNEADGEISDGISVISESDLDHHDTIERCEELPKLKLNEKLAAALQGRKSSGEDDLEPIKKITSVSSRTELAPFTNNQPMVTKLMEVAGNHRTTISILILAIFVACIGGFLSHIGIMIQSFRTKPDDVSNFLVYQHKIEGLNSENAELKQRIAEFEAILSTMKHDDVRLDSNKDKNRPPSYPPSGNGKGKRVRTRYDQFKRAPVAAGGDEDPLIVLHTSASLDPTDPLWFETHENDNRNEINEKTVLSTPNSDNIHLNDDTIDLSNFEPIAQFENRENHSNAADLPRKHETKNFSELDMNETKPSTNEDINSSESLRPEKNERFQKNAYEKKNDYKIKYDKKEQKKRQKSEKRELSKNGKKQQQRWSENNDKRGSEKTWEASREDHRVYEQPPQHENSFEVKNLHSKKYKQDDNALKSKSNEQHDKYVNNKRSRDRSYFDRKSSPYRDNNDKKNPDWKRRDGSEKPPYNSKKYKNNGDEKDWFTERKQNREKSRKNLDDDWFSERSLDRELLRARTDNSAERSP